MVGRVDACNLLGGALREQLLVLLALRLPLDALARRGQLAVDHNFPVDSGKVRMLLDLLRAGGCGSDPPLVVLKGRGEGNGGRASGVTGGVRGGYLDDEPLAELLARLGGEVAAFVDGLRVAGVGKGEITVGELVKKHADRVPVSGATVRGTALGCPAHLGRHVAVGADARGARGHLRGHELREAHVDQPDVTVRVHEEVFRLEVAIEDVLRMDVREDLDGLHEDPVDLLGGEPPASEHELREISRDDEVHDETQVL